MNHLALPTRSRLSWMLGKGYLSPTVILLRSRKSTTRRHSPDGCLATSNGRDEKSDDVRARYPALTCASMTPFRASVCAGLHRGCLTDGIGAVPVSAAGVGILHLTPCAY